MSIRYWRAAALFLAIALASPAFAAPAGKTVRTSDPAERFAAMDASRDGKIAWEEFSSARPNLNRNAFDMIDADHDGGISLEEWKAFSSGHGGAVKSPAMSSMMKAMGSMAAPAENLIPSDPETAAPSGSMPLIMPPKAPAAGSAAPAASPAMPLIMPPKADK